MALQLAPEEPEAGPWRTEPLTALVEALTRRAPGKVVSGRPVIVAIDGRSNNGKTWLAARIARAVPGSVVIHTDSVAWEHSRFGWADLLIDGILLPVHRSGTASYRPPRWVERDQDGSLDVPAGCPLLIIEGDGAGRREVAHLIDALIWVQADEREAERRRLAREQDPDALDLANKAPGAPPFDHAGWMAEEIPFNAAQRTWERADVIVCGTPEIPCDPGTQVVVAPPPRPAAAGAPGGNNTTRALRGWWASPPRSGMQRIIAPWEYRHLRFWAYVRVGVAFVLVGLGVVTLSFGGNNWPTYGWTAFWLVLAAAQLSVACWFLAIARSAPPRT